MKKVFCATINNFYLGNPTTTAPFYPLQLMNYDRDAAMDPSLQNNVIRVRSASQVGKLLTNILLAVTISTRSPSTYTLLF
jgi:hypothetical protein